MTCMAAVDQYPDVPSYLGTVALGAALGVRPSTVTMWLTRYPPGSDHPFPAPDVAIGDTLGWARERLDEIKAWRAGMPGRGSGGGRPRKQAQADA